MIGTTEIHEYISTSFNKKPALSPSGKTPPFLEKTYFHHLQAEDSVAFTEPKAQDVESEVWWPWGRTGPTMGGSLVAENSPKKGEVFGQKKP